MGITYHGTTGQTLYTRVQTGASTFKGVALTEGSSGGLGVYNVTDAVLVSGGLTSTPGDYAYTIRVGTASDTANDLIVGVGMLGWAGTIERPPYANTTQVSGTPQTPGDIFSGTTGLGVIHADTGVGGVLDGRLEDVIDGLNTQAELVTDAHGPKIYYVAASGGNDANSGLTRALPFATIAAAYAATVSGDTIWLIAGTYADTGTPSVRYLTVAKPRITIRGDGESTILAFTSLDGGILVTGDHCVVRDLKGTNTAVQGGVIYANATGCIVENVTATGKEFPVYLAGDNSIARNCVLSGGAYGLWMGGRNYLVDQCRCSLDCTYTNTVTPFAGINTVYNGVVRNAFVSVVAVSTTTSQTIVGLSASSHGMIAENVKVEMLNLSSNVTGGFYGVADCNGTASVAKIIGGTLLAIDTAGTATEAEINASVSGSRVTLDGTKSAAANWLGASNIRRVEGALKPTVEDRTADVDAAGAVLDRNSVAILEDTGTTLPAAIAGIEGGGGGTPAQVDNTEVVPVRVFKLSRRDDGVLAANKTLRMKVGEVYPVWIDPTPFAGGHWLENVTDEESSGAGLDITSVGMNRELVVIWLEALTAGSYTVLATAHPRSAESLICELAVVVTEVA